MFHDCGTIHTKPQNQFVCGGCAALKLPSLRIVDNLGGWGKIISSTTKESPFIIHLVNILKWFVVPQQNTKDTIGQTNGIF